MNDYDLYMADIVHDEQKIKELEKRNGEFKNMDIIKDLNEILSYKIVDETYVNGNIDKFIITVIKRSTKEVADLVELDDKDKSKKEYFVEVSNCVKSLDFISKVIQTKKIEQNRGDFIKLGKELLNIGEELINLGKENI